MAALSTRLRLIWRHGFQPGSTSAFAFAFACVAAATAFRFALGLMFPDILIFAAYYPAIMIAALLGGLSAGALALTLSAIAGWWMFLPPASSFAVQKPSEAISVAVFVAMAIIILAASEGYRRLLRRHYETEQHTALIVSELQHRLKNKIATVQAVIHQELRAHPDLAQRMAARLRALALTDELLFKADGRGAELNDIVNNELRPYCDVSDLRVRFDGASVALPPKVATATALVVHELATNAAKYGALSIDGGRLDIECRQQGTRVELLWRESGCSQRGPVGNDGFGTRLLKIALEPYHGVCERTFDAAGLTCRIAFDLPCEARPPAFLGESHIAAAPAKAVLAEINVTDPDHNG